MAKRTDHNQRKIVEALRQVGATVVSLHEVGRGVPDLLVGFRGQNFLLEVKNPDNPSRRLTPEQVEFLRTWRGQVAVVETPLEALRAIGAVVK